MASHWMKYDTILIGNFCGIVMVNLIMAIKIIEEDDQGDNNNGARDMLYFTEFLKGFEYTANECDCWW